MIVLKKTLCFWKTVLTISHCKNAKMNVTGMRNASSLLGIKIPKDVEFEPTFRPLTSKSMDNKLQPKMEIPMDFSMSWMIQSLLEGLYLVPIECLAWKLANRIPNVSVALTMKNFLTIQGFAP